ncbi:unnamed protein product [Linum trigynum]|uniref:Glabrous enhancer-binding protein-like DBD domain-containing protein n=1 Tax=Linum trigynum TaxID=586398 RepID=A0AAV2DZH1_9ROSI
MASKRPNPKKDPPAASSEEDSSSTDEASSAEEMPPQVRTLPPHPQPKNPTVEKPDSDSEYESDTDSDSVPPPKSSGVLHNVKPIASKPQPKAQVRTAAPASSSKSTPATKRASETEREAKDSKRQKKVVEGDAEGDGKNEYTPRVLFQRLWGENDEIALLNGLIEFAEKKGADPLKDLAVFYDFIKKSVAVDVSLSQLKEKVVRLRKKFKNHAKGKNGLDKSFSKAHDQKTFDLSKMIWDSQGESLLGRIAIGKSSGKAKKSSGANVVGSSKSASKDADLVAANGHENATRAALGSGNEGGETMEIDGVNDQKDGLIFDWSPADAEVEAFVVNKGMDMVDGSKRNELARRWKELDIEALEHFVKRKQLIIDQAQMILDSSSS